MKHNNRWIAVGLAVACLLLASCKQAETPAPVESDGPAKIEHLDGTDATRVTLKEEAAKRLDVQTAPIRDAQIDGKQRRVIPYAAILYDIKGDTWTYISPEPFVFVRHPIKVDFIKGEDAILLDDLPAGTAVVTVGAAELYGSESEFEEE
jgi:hypothetical protein